MSDNYVPGNLPGAATPGRVSSSEALIYRARLSLCVHEEALPFPSQLCLSILE